MLMSIAKVMLNNRRNMLEDRITKRMLKIKSFVHLSPSILRSKTQDRVRMRDELQKVVQQEDEQNKYIMYKRKQEFGKIITKDYAPEISQKKREEMQKLIRFANASAREKIPKIKYTRPNDSILNKSDLLFTDVKKSLHGSNNKFDMSPKTSVEGDDKYSKTLAFGKREETGGEYSPERAYIPSGELETVKERLRK